MSLQWKTIQALEKEPFLQRAIKGSEGFDPEKKEYEEFKKSKLAKQEKKIKRALPKPPLTPFLKFQQDDREQNSEEYKNLSITESSKVTSEKWKTMDFLAKAKYRGEYKLQKQIYDKSKQNLKIKKLKGSKNKLEKKRVHQPFVAFIKSHYNEIKASTDPSNLKHVEIMRMLSTRWKSLSSADKETYKERVKQDTIVS